MNPSEKGDAETKKCLSFADGSIIAAIQPCRLNHYKFRRQSKKRLSFESSLNCIDDGY